MDIWKVLEYTLAVTTVGMMIWLVKLFFHDKLDARWHYFIWLVLLVRLVIPVDFALIHTPVSVLQGIPLSRWIDLGRLAAGRKGYQEAAGLLGKIYLWGVALLGGYYFATWLVLKLCLKNAPRADESTRGYVNGIAEKYGLKTCSDIRSYHCNAPFICGLVRPVLVLPQGRAMPEEAVIVHELLHRKWKDVSVNVAIRIVRVVNWFNPAVWFLTGVVQNDSEALCDQRVLEYCREGMQKDYGDMLLAMAEKGAGNPVRTGTSNMANSYRNMRIRIRRICDFRKVPPGIGVVAACITLMLTAAGVGTGVAPRGFELREFRTDAELQKNLWEAEIYRADTPEEALWLFLQAAAEHNVFYRAAVLPQRETAAFEAFAEDCRNKGILDGKGGITVDSIAASTGQKDYFPQETTGIWQCRIYNLQYDGNQGTATVYAELGNGHEEAQYTEWKLELEREEGWKVRLVGDTGRRTGEYREPPMLQGSLRTGDFLLEAWAYNEAYFSGFGRMQQRLPDTWGNMPYGQDALGKDYFPDHFTVEYRVAEYGITYLGEESLEGCTVRVEITENGKEAAEMPTPEEAAAEASAEAAGEGYDAGSFSGDGYCVAEFDGKELIPGEPRGIGGGGSGFVQPGQGWNTDTELRVHVRIYVDGRLVVEDEAVAVAERR